MNRLAKYLQWGLLAIVALMPVHAFLSVWLGHLLGHEALIQAWKELVLLLLAAGAAVLLARDRSRLQRLRQPWVLAAAALIALGLIVTAVLRPLPVLAAFGAKTDLEFLAAALVATAVTTKAFLYKLTHIILIGAAVVSGFDLLQIFLLPPDFLTAFGYGPQTILPYQHIAAGATALRFPATLGGPNQLGTYLILPLCLTAALFIRQRRWWQALLFAACLISLIWTFSRSAWIGAAAAVIITVLAVLPRPIRRWGLAAGALVLIAALALIPLALKHGGQLQYLVLHASVATHDQANLSDSQHAQSLQDGLRSVLTAPFGHGLGTAGPGTFYAGTTNIIEDYYLQIGYEMGVLAVLLFLALIVLIINQLARTRASLSLPLSAAIIGISLVAFVLPAWVDSSTALIVWITAGAGAGAKYV